MLERLFANTLRSPSFSKARACFFDVSRYPPALIFFFGRKTNTHTLQWDQLRIRFAKSKSLKRSARLLIQYTDIENEEVEPVLRSV